MQKESSFDNNFNWANEYFVLFEAPNELIILHRNVIRNEEIIIMSTSLMSNSKNNERLWCAMVEEHELLRHVFRIKRYQKKQDNFKFFKRFFNMTFEEFITNISEA